MNTSKLKSAPLSTFPFDTKIAICKDRYLHIQQPNVGVPKEDTSSSKLSVLISVHKTGDIDESEDRIQARRVASRWKKNQNQRLS